MAKSLQLALWNANGLTQHTEELKTFISIHERISQHQRLQKKSAATSLNTVLASAHSQTTY
jgi:hypothetical protein